MTNEFIITITPNTSRAANSGIIKTIPFISPPPTKDERIER